MGKSITCNLVLVDGEGRRYGKQTKKEALAMIDSCRTRPIQSGTVNGTPYSFQFSRIVKVYSQTKAGERLLTSGQWPEDVILVDWNNSETLK